MSNPQSCPFCGLVDGHTDNCYFTLKLEGATIGVIQAAWNRRAPVSTPQQSAQRASVDTPEFKRLMFAWLEAQNGAPSVAAYAALIAHINAWGSAGSGATPEGWKLVPVEPTPAMIAAMHFKGDVDIAIGHAQFYADAEEDYAAMLAAAPSPAPQGEQA